MSDVLGVVLAAGQSIRMGQPKALLTCPPTGRTFVTQIIDSLRAGGLGRVAVVGRVADAKLQAEVARAVPPVAFLENPSPELGQLSSVHAGISYAETTGAGAMLVVPVDMPLVRPDTIRAALAAFAEADEPVLRVSHRGRHGHPVIFSAAMFAALRAADLSAGARAVLRADPSRVRDLEVDDPGVLRDVDYPADYQALFDRHPG